MKNFTTEPTVSNATIVNDSPVVTVTGSATQSIAQGSNTLPFTFAPPDQQTASQSYMISSIAGRSNAVGASLMSGLVNNMKITVVGVGLSTKIVSSALSPLLTTLSVGNVTVTASGARCSAPILVQ
jgi:hypothetical protein